MHNVTMRFSKYKLLLNEKVDRSSLSSRESVYSSSSVSSHWTYCSHQRHEILMLGLKFAAGYTGSWNCSLLLSVSSWLGLQQRLVQLNRSLRLSMASTIKKVTFYSKAKLSLSWSASALLEALLLVLSVSVVVLFTILLCWAWASTQEFQVQLACSSSSSQRLTRASSTIWMVT